jgi:hypothetical protein
MRILALILLLAVGWTSIGQTFIGRPLKPLSAGFDYLLPPGMKHRWRSSDLAASLSPGNAVSIWTDSISGWNWTQSNAPERPTYTTNGVAFVSPSYLAVTNLIPTTSSIQNWLVVLKHNVTTAPQIVVGRAFSGGNIFLGFGNDANGWYEQATGNSAITPIGTNKISFLAAKTTNAVAYQAYTNGVSGWSAAFGWNNISPNNLTYQIGSGIGNAYFNGNLYEVIIWTNATFTASQIANIHAYCTNVYGITP